MLVTSVSSLLVLFTHTAYSQITRNPYTGQIMCPTTNGTFCSAASMQTSLLITCKNGTPTVTDCITALNVPFAVCSQSSPLNGTAICVSTSGNRTATSTSSTTPTSSIAPSPYRNSTTTTTTTSTSSIAPLPYRNSTATTTTTAVATRTLTRGPIGTGGVTITTVPVPVSNRTATSTRSLSASYTASPLPPSPSPYKSSAASDGIPSLVFAALLGSILAFVC